MDPIIFQNVFVYIIFVSMGQYEESYYLQSSWYNI